MTACAGSGSMFVSEELPSIAHVHIGHAITGWKEAPEEKGLLVAAEQFAEKSLSESRALEEQAANLKAMKEIAGELLHTLDPTVVDADSEEYGLRNSFAEAIDHLTFAAQSDDASENVKESVVQIEKNSFAVLEQTDLIIALAMAIADADSALEAEVLAEELLPQVEANVNGDSAGTIGIAQIRQEIDEMIAREVPPYQPVAKKHLFGLIRLPDGKWMFSWLLDPFDDENGGGGGGGY